jgi:hypothetical protein
MRLAAAIRNLGIEWAALPQFVLGMGYIVIFPLYARVGAPPSGGEAWFKYLPGKTTICAALRAAGRHYSADANLRANGGFAGIATKVESLPLPVTKPVAP